MEEFDNQPIVLDNGSGTIRCGFSGDEKPRVSYSSVIGRPKYKKINYLPSDLSIDDTFVGNQAQLRRGLLKLKYPIEHGTIEDWDSMELIWQQLLLHDLVNDDKDTNSFSLNEHSILITEHAFTIRRQREKMCEIFFEHFNVNSINISIPTILSLYSTGRTTGVSVDIGDGVASIASIYDGFALPSTMKRINLGGRDITRLLRLEMMKNGYLMNSSSEFEIIRNMKERLGFIDVGDNDENDSFSVDKFQLPDGKFLRIPKSSISKSCELLFNPELFGFEESNVSNELYNSINKTDLNLRGQLFESIVISGGSTLLKNFNLRLLKDLKKIDNGIKLKIFASHERRNNCFIGGSILSTLSTFNKILVSKKQFLEDSNCIHDRYF